MVCFTPSVSNCVLRLERQENPTRLRNIIQQLLGTALVIASANQSQTLLVISLHSISNTAHADENLFRRHASSSIIIFLCFSEMELTFSAYCSNHSTTQQNLLKNKLKFIRISGVNGSFLWASLKASANSFLVLRFMYLFVSAKISTRWARCSFYTGCKFRTNLASKCQLFRQWLIETMELQERSTQIQKFTY